MNDRNIAAINAYRAILNRPLRSTQAIMQVLMVALTCNVAFCAEPIAYDAPKLICKLKNRRINESSGLAVSRRDSDLFWTHNDSGDLARIFCFDTRGKHVGTCKLKGAKSVDWEDMCSFDLNGQPKLLVADVGDNGSKRKSCNLYLIDEPKNPKDDIKKFQTIKLKYASGPCDCESIGVDTVNEKLLLVEKRRWISCRVFEADFSEKARRGTVIAKRIGRLELPLVTAMDVSPDGLRAVVLTLGQAFEYTRGVEESWTTAFSRKPRTLNMPARKQGEAICYGANGKDLFLTSEFAPSPFFGVFATPN